jgi:hypothetical protein
MPQTDTSTAPDVSKSARSDKPAAAADPKSAGDPVKAALVAAADIVMQQKLPDVVASITGSLATKLEQLVPGSDPTSDQDPCTRPKETNNAQITGFCFTRQQSLDQAEHVYKGAAEDATATFETAKRTWTRALGQYDFTMKQADTTLQQAVATAVNTYNNKWNKDSSSRSFYLYFTMKQQIAAALVAFEGSAASAGGTLAGQVGTLTAAYQSFLAAIQGAAIQQLDDDATAQQTFWQSVEGVLDAT